MLLRIFYVDIRTQDKPKNVFHHLVQSTETPANLILSKAVVFLNPFRPLEAISLSNDKSSSLLEAGKKPFHRQSRHRCPNEMKTYIDD